MCISVITTTYNCAPFIYEAIHSVLNQTFEKFEYLIVDDGSTDDTESVVMSFNDERIHYYKITHVGRSKALNYGLEKCNRDWIALIDADDIWHPQKLEKQLTLVDKENDIIFTDSLFRKDDSIQFAIECPRNKIELFETVRLHGHMTNSSLVFNSKHVKNLGAYDETLSNSEDYDLLIRLINNSNYKFVPEYLVLCKIRKDSLSRLRTSETKRNIRSIQKKYFENQLESSRLYLENNSSELFAWREYFYGERKHARKIWFNNPRFFFTDYRIPIAFVITLLPNYLFERFLINNYRLRIEFLLRKIFHKKQINRSHLEFKSIYKNKQSFM